MLGRFGHAFTRVRREPLGAAASASTSEP
ncbi:argininosuccinate lyase [Cryobacterium roopkundense]|uniref:Argininosuccinate lyase n=1 Tax=Cryobacterium roopkundense TaxID=1001240 RepID=A0A7W8ZYB8_9MICO|nr:argininosuccinate lyase [Cryobacterium roopkundense]